jgi:hypothetical protein
MVPKRFIVIGERNLSAQIHANLFQLVIPVSDIHDEPHTMAGHLSVAKPADRTEVIDNMAIEIRDFKPTEIFDFIKEQSNLGAIDIQMLMKANNRFAYALTDWLNEQLRQRESEWAFRELTNGNAEFVSSDEAMTLIEKAFTLYSGNGSNGDGP